MADKHIKIGDVVPRSSYVADGIITRFDVPFPFFEDSDLHVYVDGVSAALGTDYTVMGAGDSTGGDIEFFVPPAVDQSIVIVRQVAAKRVSDFSESGVLRADVINTDLDRIHAVLQQIDSRLDRMPQVAEGEVSAFPDGLTLTRPAPGRALGWNADGDGLANLAIQGPTGPQGATGPAGVDGVFAEIASQAEAEAGSENTKGMTALRTAQAIDGRILDEDDFVSDSDTKAPSQQSVRAFVEDGFNQFDGTTDFEKGFRCKALMNRGMPSAISRYTSLFVMEDGSVRVAGDNAMRGQAQGGSRYNQPLPGTVSLPPGFVGLPVAGFAGYSQSAVLSDAGDIVMWGFNDHGQLGDGSTTARNQATLIDPVIGPRSGVADRKVVKLVHSGTGDTGSISWYALTEGGEVYAWGLNNRGQLGQGDTTNRSSPTVMLDQSGNPVSDIVDIVAGGGELGGALAVKSDNTVLACGEQNVYQTGFGSVTDVLRLSPPIGLPTGEVVKRIRFSGGQDTNNAGVSGVLYENGDLYMAGANPHGELGQGDTAVHTVYKRVDSLAGLVDDFWLGGDVTSCFAAIKGGGLYSWGFNSIGQLGLADTINTSTPQPVTLAGSQNRTVIAVSIGGTFATTDQHSSMVLTDDGRVFVAGRHAYGSGPRLNSSTFLEWLTPNPGHRFIDIDHSGHSSESYMHALDDTGAVYAAGNKAGSQLGTGRLTDIATVPQRVRF